MGLEAQGLVLPPTYKGETEAAFEKIYIDRSQLVHMPDGVYYYDDNGQEIKVKTLLCDKQGLYILRVCYQCQLCGRTYIDRMPEDEEGCPIYERELMPGIWSKR